MYILSNKYEYTTRINIVLSKLLYNVLYLIYANGNCNKRI